MDSDSEIEVLQVLIKACRAMRDVRRSKAKLRLAAPAAVLELEFENRIKKLKKPSAVQQAGS